jgi:peptidoglycan hydrolase-like protein with peptidoglycan-binding domain
MAWRPRIELSGARVHVMPREIAVMPFFRMARIENAFCILSTLSLEEQELDKMAKGVSNSMGFFQWRTDQFGRQEETMEAKMNRNGWWMIFFSVILFACLVSGCPKSKEAVAPGTEEMKETPKSVVAPLKSEQELTSKPASAPSRPAPASPAVPTQPKGPHIVEKTLPSASAPEATKDLIAGGEVLLNPAVPQDAEKIQSRLADLGLYKAPIDGIWGKGSRAALMAFKQQNALGSSDKWDKETQIALFREAGEAPGDSQESISSGSALLNPSSSQDARKIQTRLQELGLYKGPIDGLWGKGSQAALNAFKKQNSLADPDKWDKETQMLLFK